jgi:hypothetical protein
MPGTTDLRSVRTFPQLVAYLRDELDWPIQSDDFDELTFDYEPAELGLDEKSAVKVKEIKQLRPLVKDQPWGVFFINFEPKRLPVVVLRRVLSSLVIKKRKSANKPQQAAWQLHDLLFISSYGLSEHRDITLAHFAEEPDLGDLPTLRVLGWDDEDTVLHVAHADKVLRERLRWPGDPTRTSRPPSRWLLRLLSLPLVSASELNWYWPSNQMTVLCASSWRRSGRRSSTISLKTTSRTCTHRPLPMDC